MAFITMGSTLSVSFIIISQSSLPSTVTFGISLGTAINIHWISDMFLQNTLIFIQTFAWFLKVFSVSQFVLWIWKLVAKCFIKVHQLDFTSLQFLICKKSGLIYDSLTSYLKDAYLESTMIALIYTVWISLLVLWYQASFIVLHGHIDVVERQPVQFLIAVNASDRWSYTHTT